MEALAAARQRLIIARAARRRRQLLARLPRRELFFQALATHQPVTANATLNG